MKTRARGDSIIRAGRSRAEARGSLASDALPARGLRA